MTYLRNDCAPRTAPFLVARSRSVPLPLWNVLASAAAILNFLILELEN
jgi:hypothetical protein